MVEEKQELPSPFCLKYWSVKNLSMQMKLLFFWLPSVEMAVNRVARLVSEGGHHSSSDVIVRRYSRGIENFFKIYKPLCDNWILFDNEEQTAGYYWKRV